MTEDLVNGAGRVREGEELDAGRIEFFVKDNLPGLAGPVSVKQFPSGFSNLTYLIIAGDRELVLRRPPFGTKAKTAHDMGREYRVLSALESVFPYGPRPLLYTEDESIIGCPFYIMERIKGIILRRDLPPGMSLSAEQAARLCRRFTEILVELHRLDYGQIGLGDFGKPRGYVQRQVEGWSRRYRNARTPDAPDGEEVMAWIAEKMPPDSDPSAVIHGDFKLDNVVLDPADPTRIIGVLDWEMATIGDPAMDLGNSLAYWVQADDPPHVQAIRRLPTNLDGALTRQEVVELYVRESGRAIDNFDYYHVFGLFRLAVIAQQIYYRFYHGQTKDQRFKALILAVHVLDQFAREAIGKSGL
ncbi:MAG: phosphotransferase family protein [Proteobacteria bacterium]|nr:phosphotransferase family protein [Pseudomonadota bacterium]MBU1742471.1 phosphotransferase family protein [Pseudomonadota bacterium]